MASLRMIFVSFLVFNLFGSNFASRPGRAILTEYYNKVSTLKPSHAFEDLHEDLALHRSRKGVILPPPSGPSARQNLEGQILLEKKKPIPPSGPSKGHNFEGNVFNPERFKFDKGSFNQMLPKGAIVPPSAPSKGHN